eukprot:5917027-Pyramimonas_sp.AAC.1
MLDDFVWTLRAAGARVEVVERVRQKFRCEHCTSHSRPYWRRRAQLPRTYSFNRLLSIDLFYLDHQGESLPVLNM